MWEPKGAFGSGSQHIRDMKTRTGLWKIQALPDESAVVSGPVGTVQSAAALHEEQCDAHCSSDGPAATVARAVGSLGSLGSSAHPAPLIALLLQWWPHPHPHPEQAYNLLLGGLSQGAKAEAAETGGQSLNDAGRGGA